MRKVLKSLLVVVLVLFAVGMIFTAAEMAAEELGSWLWGILFAIVFAIAVVVMICISIARTRKEAPSVPDVTVIHPDGSSTEVWYLRRKK